MSAQKIDKSGWKVFFDAMSKVLPGKQAEVEVASLDVGDQIDAEWVPLIGIIYDHKDDLVEVALEGLDHMILKPSEIFVDYGVGGLVAIEVIDADGTQQIIKLKDPLALPAPEQVASGAEAG
jgi:hypothetical protein